MVRPISLQSPRGSDLLCADAPARSPLLCCLQPAACSPYLAWPIITHSALTTPLLPAACCLQPAACSLQPAAQLLRIYSRPLLIRSQVLPALVLRQSHHMHSSELAELLLWEGKSGFVIQHAGPVPTRALLTYLPTIGRRRRSTIRTRRATCMSPRREELSGRATRCLSNSACLAVVRASHH